MNRNEMTQEQADRFHSWIAGEWERCMALRGTLENHAITYLLTANGGGAATVMAFAGSAHYQDAGVFTSLACFMFGLLSCGLAIADGFERMSQISSELSSDWRKFNKCEMGMAELDTRHHDRFQKKSAGKRFGYASFFLFIAGVALSFGTFAHYMDVEDKKAAESLKKAATETPAPAVTAPTATKK